MLVMYISRSELLENKRCSCAPTDGSVPPTWQVPNSFFFNVVSKRTFQTVFPDVVQGFYISSTAVPVCCASTPCLRPRADVCRRRRLRQIVQGCCGWRSTHRPPEGLTGPRMRCLLLLQDRWRRCNLRFWVARRAQPVEAE
jgi:hypothetical protein